MAEFNVTIACDNAVFQDDLAAELTRILRQVAHEVGEVVHGINPRGLTGAIQDANGNHVGWWQYRA